MKLRISVLSTSVFVLQCALAAQTSNTRQWVGVWQAELDNQPGVTITLGRDAGELAGTIVFNVVSREGGEAHVIGHDAHALTHVRLDDHTLAFEVIRLGDGRELHLTMRLTDDEKAQLLCADCGGPSAVDLQRVR